MHPPAKFLAATHVLTVDDDAFMRELVRRVLTRAGMRVETYGSAAELLVAADPASAQVLLLDVQMPGMSGLELQDLLVNRGIAVPVVFLSGTADLAMAVTAMRNGAADFIEKPFDSESLIERIHQAVQRRGGKAATPEPPADPQVMARFETLTPREREVFELLVTGMSSKLIARALGGSHRTVEIHRAQVMRKLQARNLPELVRMSIESLPTVAVHGF
ncbi:MAG: response regulator [Rubrivivax sp.]|nr:response regulator [Rubrivivax sp.]MDP3225929.1 response regulator [Rubrivivax sp.]MDP3611734.1 response regulator [Rubrivivax sp.]